MKCSREVFHGQIWRYLTFLYGFTGLESSSWSMCKHITDTMLVEGPLNWSHEANNWPNLPSSFSHNTQQRNSGPVPCLTLRVCYWSLWHLPSLGWAFMGIQIRGKCRFGSWLFLVVYLLGGNRLSLAPAGGDNKGVGRGSHNSISIIVGRVLSSQIKIHEGRLHVIAPVLRGGRVWIRWITRFEYQLGRE